MAKFLVTSGSYFQPFTYDEMVKPLAQMAEAQNAAQDAYDALSMETAALEGYISQNEDDVEARALYDNYMKRLNTLQDNLWGYGYTPQTRRDLSLARSGYAQNIKGKLQNNIEKRQAQSKAFWDAKHSNPDLVTGRDPGSFGLDNYIRDPNFGNDWYSYDGSKFRASVAAEVKSRASELKNHIDITSDPRLAGVLTRWESGGFTNEDTLRAGSLVDSVINLSEEDRKKYYKEHNTGDEMIILAESLINQYNSTGARDADMDNRERQRLIDYGKSGWSEGVLGKSTKDFDDKVYDEKRDMRKLAKQHEYAIEQMDHQAKNEREKAIWDAFIKNGGLGTSSGSSTEKPGSISMGTTAKLTTSGYNDLVKETEKQFKYYQAAPNGTITVFGPGVHGDKSPYYASDPYQLADVVYGTDGRETIRKAFGGYDIALGPDDNVNGGNVTWVSKNGEEIGVVITRAGKRERETLGLGEYGEDALVVRYADNGQVWQRATAELNKETKILNEQVSGFKNNDPDIDKKLITPKQQNKMRTSERYKNYDIRSPWSEFYDYATTKDYTALRSAISIAGYEHYNENARKSMGSALAATYRGNGKNMGKDSNYAIHVVGSDNTTFSDGITDYGIALGRDDKGNLLDNTITDVHAYLEDLARGKYGRYDGSSPMVRFQTEKSNDTFAVDPIAFGSEKAYEINGRLDEISIPEIGSDKKEYYTLSQEIAYCLWPILERDIVNSMSNKESQEWGWRAYKMIGGSDFPVVKNSSGTQYRPIGAKEIAKDPQLRDKLYQLVWENLGSKSMKRFLDAINK